MEGGDAGTVMDLGAARDAGCSDEDGMVDGVGLNGFTNGGEKDYFTDRDGCFVMRFLGITCTVVFFGKRSSAAVFSTPTSAF